MNHHVMIFGTGGTGRCLWTEAVPLQELGRLDVQRASTVEFNQTRQVWEVRLASAPEVVAYEHSSRDTCLDWERSHLNALL
jgi:hypothetical protein